jgi:hypothetical protein
LYNCLKTAYTIQLETFFSIVSKQNKAAFKTMVVLNMVTSKPVESKTHLVTDKRNINWSYRWFNKNHRTSENNNALVKLTPKLMSKIQEKCPALTSGEKIARHFCALIGVACDDLDFVFANPSATQSVQNAEAVSKPVAVTDSETLRVLAMVDAWLVQCGSVGHNPTADEVSKAFQQIPEPHREAAYRKYLPEMAERVYKKLPASVVPAFTFK